MKRLSIILAILIFAAPAMAQTWYTANQVTVACDAVPLPTCTCATPPCTPTVVCPGPTYPSSAVGQVKYQFYSRGDLVSTGAKVGGEINTPQLLISLTTWGRYYIGVQSGWLPQGESVIVWNPTKAWSNVPADTANNPFGVMFYAITGSPGGLRIVP